MAKIVMELSIASLKSRWHRFGMAIKKETNKSVHLLLWSRRDSNPRPNMV